jgi:V8-like Glu-specific endopeptidase
LKEEFSLTKKIISAQNKINLSTQLNFISTNDITGGNSGSPVVNSKLEFVGIIFDGNSHSHILNYFYEDEFSRAVSVDAMGIIEALDKIYQTKPLLKELGF